MSIQETILIGVLSGVLTACLIFLVKEFWVKIIIPWYQGFRYQGADISGSWYAEYRDEDSESVSTFSVVLSQNAHKITGSMQFNFVSSERKLNIDYNLVGEYWEGYLNLSCRSKDRRLYSHAAMFLKLINGGSGLLGQFSFRNAYADQVNSIPLGLDRN
ncbi:hypothetical protein [Microbulbifer celer]|uniref:SMODS-associating 2TM beta-strand rich effector domain-containing protein n=1 Tax=Microbulbifer celer TaxID=435905 RepID=A0ABW3UCF9_9GAMM|nr:hypothetical protein [Microbulbifer celer]UFN56844.1 hypothetical protein LPW13_14905 [Microbulbifer celer]